jgi:hypothetical protein
VWLCIRFGPYAGTTRDVRLRQPLGHDALQLQIAGGFQNIVAGKVQVLSELNCLLVLSEQTLKALLSLHQRQRADILITKEKESIFQLAENSFELIPPLLKDIDEYDLKELGAVDFSHKVLCCHVAVEKSDGRDVIHIIQQSKPGEVIELQFNDIDTSGRLHIPGELSKTVIEEALRRAPRIVTDRD